MRPNLHSRRRFPENAVPAWLAARRRPRRRSTPRGRCHAAHSHDDTAAGNPHRAVRNRAAQLCVAAPLRRTSSSTATQPRLTRHSDHHHPMMADSPARAKDIAREVAALAPRPSTTSAAAATPSDVLALGTELGVDIEAEPHLLWVLGEYATTPLPPHFSSAATDDGLSYVNELDGSASPQHPAASHFARLLASERRAHAADDAARAAAGEVADASTAWMQFYAPNGQSYVEKAQLLRLLLLLCCCCCYRCHYYASGGAAATPTPASCPPATVLLLLLRTS